MRRAAWLALLLLCACAPRPDGCALLGGAYRYCAVAGAGPSFEAEYASAISARGRSLQVLSRLRANGGELDLAVLSPLGQTLLQARLRDGRVTEDPAAPLAGKLDASLLVGLMQLASWPADAVRAGLGDNLVLEEGPGRRIVRAGQDTILEITWQGSRPPYDQVRAVLPAAGLSIISNRLESE